LAVRRSVIQIQSRCRGYLIRRNYRAVQEERAAITIQRYSRGTVQRQKFLSVRGKIILAQCCVRRFLARKELKTLREEARSISHIKEVSYQLENKVIDLTQNLAKRTQENRSLLAQLSVLESQLASWQERHSTLQERATIFERDAVKANDAIAKSLELEQELKTLQERQDQTQRNSDKWERESAELKETLIKRSSELEEAVNARESAEQVRGSLNQEIQSLKSELERLNQNPQPMPNGLTKTPSIGKLNGMLSVSANKRSNRTPRRRSYVDGVDVSPGDDIRALGSAYNLRPTSTAFSPSNLPKTWLGSPNNGHGLDIPIHYENIDAEIQRLLEEDELLNEEATLGLIRSLKIPQPSSQNPVSEREVLFPAHLINLVTSQMWRYGYVKESERFLANVMQGIQQQVMVLPAMSKLTVVS
jgi:myosin V